MDIRCKYVLTSYEPQAGLPLELDDGDHVRHRHGRVVCMTVDGEGEHRAAAAHRPGN